MKQKPRPDWHAKWLAKKTWTLRETAMILCGWDPDGPVKDRAEFDRVRGEVLRGMARGELRPVRSSGHGGTDGD